MTDVDEPSYSMAEFKTRWAEVKRESEVLEGLSLADRLALCEADEPGTIGALLDELGPEQTTALAYLRDFWARPKQLAPEGEWLIHQHIQGRGGGKTWKASEWVIGRLDAGARELVFVGPSEDDIKQFMVGGHKRPVDGSCEGSGFLDLLPPWIPYHYREDDCIIELPSFHAMIYLHSAQVPEFRGPNPDTVWGDEIIKWRYPERLLSNLRLACRSVGKLIPQILITTSPKRIRLLRDLVMEPDVVTYHGRTDENRGNVDERWFRSERRRLDGTRQGDEELGGELGGDEEGDLFPMGVIDKHRVEEVYASLARIVVSVDPAGSKHRSSDNTGIVGLARAGDIQTGEGYVLADETKKYAWEGWGIAAIRLAEKIGASAIVLERNHFADAAAANLRAVGMLGMMSERKDLADLLYESVPRPGFKHLVDLVHKTTKRRIQIVEVLGKGDKATRAEPVSTLYQAGRVHHVGHLTRLETEMSEWDPASSVSPDGMDALVHGVIELFELDRGVKHDPKIGFSGLGEAVARRTATTAAGQAQGAVSLQGLLGQMGRGRWGSTL